MWSPDYLMNALDYLEKLVHQRLREYFQPENGYRIEPLPQLSFHADESPLGQLATHYGMGPEELVLVMTATAPHLAPGFFDRLIHQFLPEGGDFPEFGGFKSQQHRGMIPTGETALFLLAGARPSARLAYLPLFRDDHFLFKHKILTLEVVKAGDPLLSGRLILEPEFAEVFLTGHISFPKLGVNFPAEHITTEMEWDDLVLNSATLQQIHELEAWIRHHPTIMYDWGLQRKIKPGYRALFYGAPGTGKTLTAALLGKYTGKDVFRIDLSMVVSKYIGETEKNLSGLFDKAQNKNWILFFDEADSLFGKRTNVRDAHDKYANQEVSYLLQRIESFPGMVILASNFKSNIDDAFTRRFQAFINFPFPNPSERWLLWQKAFPKQIELEEGIDLQKIAEKYEITGSNIMNIVQYSCIRALNEGHHLIDFECLKTGIDRELFKEGKSS